MSQHKNFVIFVKYLNFKSSRVQMTITSENIDFYFIWTIVERYSPWMFSCNISLVTLLQGFFVNETHFGQLRWTQCHRLMLSQTWILSLIILPILGKQTTFFSLVSSEIEAVGLTLTGL